MAKIYQFVSEADKYNEELMLDFFKDIMVEDERAKKKGVFIPIEERMELVKQCMSGLVGILKASLADYTIKAGVNELTRTDMGVEIRTDMFVVNNVPEFCGLIQEADNFELDPTPDEKVCITLGFNNVLEFKEFK